MKGFSLIKRHRAPRDIVCMNYREIAALEGENRSIFRRRRRNVVVERLDVAEQARRGELVLPTGGEFLFGQ